MHYLPYTGQLSSYMHAHDAGIDLVAAAHPHNAKGKWRVCGGEAPILITTTTDGIAVSPGHVGLVCSRSGLAARGIFVVNAPGVIDAGYRGPIKVILGMLGRGGHFVSPGDRIAQLLILPLAAVQPMRLTAEEFADLPGDTRGEAGFGSTGA